MTSQDWQLVCANCGHKYPVNTAMNVRHAHCCDNPSLRVHRLEKDDD